MPCPHNEISIVQRSQQQSAVAAAAYQSGEKLFCGYDQEVKHYPEKRGIVHNEILLPANAPRSYADRNTLWNAAEAVEKQWNSQLARRWVLTIPREIPPDQYAVLVREFCEQQFVSKGMIVDFAIHDPYPPGHNPHAHVMLTMRAIDEHGKWLPKSRKVYDLDENGERIKLPSGRWKSHKEDTVDWNDQKYCEIWRHEWEVIQNRYLEANNRPERVDLRSYARQGLDIVPTVHEGAAVRQMEKRGIQTNIGKLNREIRAANRLMKSIRQLIHNLKGWITELGEKRKELLAQKEAEEATLLPNLLMKYMEIRKEERKDWTRAGQNRGTSQDLKAVSEALSYLRQKGLSTVEDLEGVQFGHNLVTDELSGQTAKGKASGFQIVHDVHVKAAATVKVALDRLIRHGDAALHITAVAAVVSQTVHAHHGDDEFVGVRALLGEFGRTVQHARKRGQSVALIQLGDKRFCEFDSVAHRFCSLSYSIGRPIALRRALSELSVVMAVRPVPAA